VDLEPPRSKHYTPVPEVFGEVRLARLLATYRRAAQFLDGAGALRSQRALARLFRAMQWHADLVPLYRRHLDGDIHSIVESGQNFGAFINSTVLDWAHLLSTPYDGAVSLSGWLTRDNWCLTGDGRVTIGNAMSTFGDLSRAALAARTRPRQRWLLDVVQHMSAKHSGSFAM